MKKVALGWAGLLATGFVLGVLWQDLEGSRASPLPAREAPRGAPAWAQELLDRMEAIEEDLRSRNVSR